tara:strand:- start:4153 stop:5838 length:1686 start_codon:yes stop_codon:yes gene_type:complete
MISFTKQAPSTISLIRPNNLARINKEANTVRKRKRRSTLSEGSIETMSRETVDSLTFAEMRTIYEKNTWVRACIDKIVTRLSLIPPKILPIEYAYTDTSNKTQVTDDQLRHIEEVAELFTNPNSTRESFGSIRQKVDRDLLVYDAGAIEIVRDKRGRPKELYASNGSEFILNTDTTGTFKNHHKAYYEKHENTSEGVWYSIDELIYMIMNPRSGTPYGTSKIETLAKTVVNAQRVENYNSELFGNDATPRLAVMFQNVSLERLEEYQKYWDSHLRGKPHRPILISTGEGEGSVKIDKVGLAPNEMSFKSYSQWMLEQIMSVFNMQPLVLGMVTPNTGKLNSERQQAQFEKDALVPQLNSFAYHINSELIWSQPNPFVGHKGGFGFKDIYVDWGMERELDATEQWDIDKDMLNQGVVTINYVREKRLGLRPVSWGNIPFKIALKQGVPTGLEELEDTELNEIDAKNQKDIENLYHNYSLPSPDKELDKEIEEDLDGPTRRDEEKKEKELAEKMYQLIDEKIEDPFENSLTQKIENVVEDKIDTLENNLMEKINDILSFNSDN